MTHVQLEPVPAATAPTVDVLEPRERVRSLVAARLFGDLVMPARIDRFELIRELGAGGMGVVYAAHDPRLDRAVALKVLARTGEAPEASRRLVREAQAMARLKHPNVVAVHEVGMHGDQVFVAMELVEGGTLAEWMRRGPRPWREVLDLLIPAGRGLAAAHAAGLVHRDFKPANILLGADGRALVSDFGLARAGADPHDERALDEAERTEELGHSLLEAPLTRTGALLGTPAYMAPEQFRGEMATPRSDVFSFCVVVWEAIFGQRPFTGATLGALVAAIESGTITPPPRSIRIPAALRRQLLRGLSRLPAARHASMTELLAALANASRSVTARRILFGALAVFAVSTGLMMATYFSSRPAVQSSAELLAKARASRAASGPIVAPPPRTLDRELFDRTLGSLEALELHVRVMPSMKEGVSRGLRLYGIRPGTIKEFGFYNGDTVIGIDEEPLTTLDSWNRAMAAASADGEVVLTVRRKDETLRLIFRIAATPDASR